MDRFLSPAHPPRPTYLFCTQTELRGLSTRAALPEGRCLDPSGGPLFANSRKTRFFRLGGKRTPEAVRNCHVWKKSLTVAHIRPYTPAQVWWLRWLGVLDGGLYTHRS